MTKKRVVITGACGYIVQRNWEELNERYDLVALDVATRRGDGREVPGVKVCDLTDENRNTYRHHFEGADAVYHSAFVKAPGLDATTFLDNSDPKFRSELANAGARLYDQSVRLAQSPVPRPNLLTALPPRVAPQWRLGRAALQKISVRLTLHS